MAKGWGKSPLAAFISLLEFCGPARFDGWDAEGDPVGAPWGFGETPPPLVQIAAVSEDQTDNTYGAIYQMLTARQGSVSESLGIDPGRTRLYLAGRPGELHPVTASAGSREGQRVTFSVFDETHLWKRENGGVRLADTIRRNAAKMGGRTFETTNAPSLGEKSVAERSGTAVELGHKGILHYAKHPSMQPEPDWTDEQLQDALAAAYGDAYWIDLARLVKEIRDPSTQWEDALRFYFNIRAAGTGRAVDPRRWDALAWSQEVGAGTYIALGFDGSITQDETWLVGCTRDGYLFPIGRWNRPPGAVDWRVPRADVKKKIEWAFSYYRVGLFQFDPPKWETEGDEWQNRWTPEVARPLDTNKASRFAPATDRFLTAIREEALHHDGDPDLADHVKALHLKKVHINSADDDGRTRYVVIKGEDRRKIDGGVAAILAYDAAMSMPDEPEEPEIMVTFR